LSRKDEPITAFETLDPEAQAVPPPSIAFMAPDMVHYARSTAPTEQRGVTLDTAFIAHPARFKGVAPLSRISRTGRHFASSLGLCSFTAIRFGRGLSKKVHDGEHT
jgi:hypothetical protein